MLNNFMEYTHVMSDQNFKEYAKGLTESNGGRDAAISEGMANLKSVLRTLILSLARKKTAAQKSVEAKPAVQPSSVTDVVAKYRSQIRQDSGIETPEAKDQPVTGFY